jgi:hypothetical protein
MSGDHTSYEQLASQRREGADYREGYAEAQRAYLPPLLLGVGQRYDGNRQPVILRRTCRR